MEQARCWLVSNGTPKCGDDSWEERAFAEDTSGILGGCVWPPRSYSCNFCRREFRSAQALGGHMNVHRRDRARLKLMSSAKSQLSTSLVDPKSYGSQDAAVIDENPSLFASSNNPQSSFVSSFVVSNNNDNNNNSNHEKTLSFFCLNDEKDQDLVVPFKITKNHEIKASYSPFMSLSTTGSSTLVTDDEDVPNNRNKRRKVVDTSSSPPLEITKKVEDHTTKVNDDLEFEELDLELRLGDRPKVS